MAVSSGARRAGRAGELGDLDGVLRGLLVVVHQQRLDRHRHRCQRHRRQHVPELPPSQLMEYPRLIHNCRDDGALSIVDLLLPAAPPATGTPRPPSRRASTGPPASPHRTCGREGEVIRAVLMFVEHIVPQSEVIRPILLGDSPCCAGVPGPGRRELQHPAGPSRWREFRHFADALSPSLLIHLRKGEGGAAEMTSLVRG